MERFNVIFSGKMQKGHTETNLPTTLKSLKFSDAHIQHVQAGKPLTLKKDLTSKQAVSLQQKLAKAGLKTHLSLVLSETCFQLGFKEVSKPKLEFSPAFVFNLRWLKSRVVAMPGTFDIKGSKGEILGKAQQFMPRLSPISRLLFSALVTLSLQFYLLRVVPQFFSSGLMTTLFGIAFLFAGLIFFPSAIRLLTIRRISDHHGQTEGSIVDQANLLPNVTTHYLYDSGDRHYATVQVKKNEVQCLSLDGQLLFDWQPNLQITSEKDAIITVADGAISDTIFGQINDYIENFRQVVDLFSRTPKLKHLDFPLSEASPIIDAYGNIAAAVFTEGLPAIRISPQHRDADFTLKAIAILAMERPLL